MNATEEARSTEIMSDWERERAAKTEQIKTETAALHPLARYLTRATGEDWTAKTDDERDYHNITATFARTRDGLEVSIRVLTPTHYEAHAWNVTAPDGTRLNIHDGRRRDEAPPSAKIARTKPQEQIARDIARRIIPLADTYAVRTLEYHAVRNAADVITEAAIKTLTDAAPLEWWKDDHNKKPGGYRNMTAHACHYLKAEIAPDGDVKLSIDNLPPEIAAEIIRIVAALPPKI